MQHIENYLRTLQKNICDAVEKHEPASQFQQDNWSQSNKNNIDGCTCVLTGDVFEKAGVNFSKITGTELPHAATIKRADIAGAPFQAMGVSVVIHPKNPFAPTAHLNVRHFEAHKKDGEKVWWFGGGFDLTPYYGFHEDCVHWHRTAKKACDAIHPDFYARFKKEADDYFFLKHRNEPRGIGGIFFDDLNQLSFEQCFLFMQKVGNGFIDAYFPIIEKRKTHSYSDVERAFQLYRRGRYAEFNLVYDRGTLFGLQAQGRAESILVSLPPVVHWVYDKKIAPESKEALLLTEFLKPQDWLK